MQPTIFNFVVLALSVQSLSASRIATKRMIAQIRETSSSKGSMDGLDELKLEISEMAKGSEAGEDAIELLTTLFGGLNTAGLVSKSEYDPATKTVEVTLNSDAVGELATKSKVPYEAQVDKIMTAQVEQQSSGAINIHMTGLYFAPPTDTKALFEEALAYKGIAAADKTKCQKECASDPNGIDCESCVAYEWYKENKGKVSQGKGKMARILSHTPFSTAALSLEKQQGNWTPSRVGDKNRRRIIYSMLAAAPACFDKFIFGTTPTDFDAPAQSLNEKRKMEPTYKDGRYMAAISREDFHGNAELEAFFKANNLAYKSLEIGKASLIGKLGTTYDYPLDMAEKMGQGSSGINFARMVSAANPKLHGQNIFVRPAKPDKVMKMLGLCQEALETPSKIDSGCSGSEGRILWKAA